MKNSKMARRYGEEFKRQAVELMIHSGKTQRQVARELDVSEYSLNLWKKAYLGQQAQPRSMPMLHKRTFAQQAEQFQTSASNWHNRSRTFEILRKTAG
ncbi:MAG TPA: transposase [Opitutaceae bacterium]|nr:transposase [Opitutaceae bacterium]